MPRTAWTARKQGRLMKLGLNKNGGPLAFQYALRKLSPCGRNSKHQQKNKMKAAVGATETGTAHGRTQQHRTAITNGEWFEGYIPLVLCLLGQIYVTTPVNRSKDLNPSLNSPPSSGSFARRTSYKTANAK